MKINIETIKLALAVIDDLDSVPFEEIEWFEDGQKIDVSQVAEEWRFIGLANSSFCEWEFWKNHWVVVNGVKKEVKGNKLAFFDIVMLALGKDSGYLDEDEIDYSVPDDINEYTVIQRNGFDSPGTVTGADYVRIKDGMIFNVVKTNLA